MQPVVCPYCRIRVVPSAPGICPGCRRDVSQVVPTDAEVIQPALSPGPNANTCPGCNASLPPAAVLCVACGYHLPTGSYLSTSVERKLKAPANPFAGDPGTVSLGATAPNSNPYASPRIPAGVVAPSDFHSDLTPSAIRQAEAIASDADMLRWTIALGLCLCPAALLVMFPWYGFRLYSWYWLNSRYDELREPNGFSPHCQVAVRFEDALFRLWVGTILGAVSWVLFAIMLLVQLVVPRHQ